MDVLILGGARTPFAAWASGKTGKGEPGGALKAFDPFDLGAIALKGAFEKTGVKPEEVDKLVFGNMYQVGPNGCYGGRHVGLRAGLPVETPCETVGLACGTGLQALISAAQEIRLGEAGVVAAVGADSSSLTPKSIFIGSFKDASIDKPIVETAQSVAAEYGFSRQEQDAWALRSHQRAAKARALGIFKEEIVSAGSAAQDDAIIENPSPDYFAQSKTFTDGGAATRANTHAIIDGGSALICASSEAAKKLGLPPLGRLVSSAVVGVAPERMAESSIGAVKKALEKARLPISAIDLFEINETYASQTLIDIKGLGIGPETVNVNGGALALGHAFGGTGPRLVLTLLKELKRRSLRRGAASISIGAGLGVAVVVERL